MDCQICPIIRILLPFDACTYWIGKLANLNVTRSKAPHKPLILLSVIDFIESSDTA